MGYGAALVCVAVAAGLAALLRMRDVPLEETIILGSGGYDLHDVRAPALDGGLLQVVAWLLAAHNSPLATFVCRQLLNDNRIHVLRDLSRQVRQLPQDKSGVEYGSYPPLVRLPASELEWHKNMSKIAYSGDAILNRMPKTDSDGGYKSSRDFYEAYKQGKTTPSQVLQRVLKAIEKWDKTVKAIQELDVAGATEAAKAADARYKAGKPLSAWDGVPIMCKSEIAIRALRQSDGRPLPDEVEAHDDILVKRFRDAGAVIVASTVMFEFGVSPVGYNPEYRGPLNPFHSAPHYPGGSSSGSTVAVAMGWVPVAIGFDGGGSIRIPAAWSGSVGLAPTFGRVPFNNSVEGFSEVVHAGPLAATVLDAALAHMLIGQPLPGHPYHALYGPEMPPPHLQPRGYRRVGIFPEWVDHCDPGVKAVFQGVVRSLREAGVEVSAFEMPHLHWQSLAHGVIVSGEFSMAHDEDFTAHRVGQGSKTPLQAGTSVQLSIGNTFTAKEHIAARRFRGWAQKQWRDLFKKYDVILTPTLPITAPEIPESARESGISNTTLIMRMMRYIFPTNLLGFPALSVPAGLDADGLPVGVQVMCDHWQEADCLAMGALLEADHVAPRQRPRGWEDVLGVAVDRWWQKPSF